MELEDLLNKTVYSVSSVYVYTHALILKVNCEIHKSDFNAMCPFSSAPLFV